MVVDLARVPVGNRPADRLRAAVGLVNAQGIRVRAGINPQVVARHRITGTWRLESRERPRAASLLGAVCLAFQPLTGGEVQEGAAAALEASWDWICGVCDGFEGEASTILLAGASRALYLDGVREGHLVFAEVHQRCLDCGAWMHRLDSECSACSR